MGFDRGRKGERGGRGRDKRDGFGGEDSGSGGQDRGGFGGGGDRFGGGGGGGGGGAPRSGYGGGGGGGFGGGDRFGGGGNSGGGFRGGPGGGAGAGGGGGVGYPFSGGSVLQTFPKIEDQIRYVYYGTEGYNAASVDIYGNPDREGGAHATGNRGVMPAFGGQLTQYEIVAVICHERYDLGGADPTSEEWADEYETWCSEESPVFAELEAGTYDFTSPDVPAMADIAPIGPVAIAGSPASAG